MRRIAALLSFSVALAVSQPADDAAAAVETFRPSADTYVDEAHPNRYFGSGKRLRTRAGSRPAKQVYVRFAVAGLAGSVTGAKLRFRVANGTSNGPAVFLTEEWPSNPLTWERRPAAVGGPRDDKGRLASDSWVEWDVTPWVTRDGAYRFALKGGAARAAGLMSRETTVVARRHDLRSAFDGRVRGADTGRDGQRGNAGAVRAPAETDWIAVYACGGESVGEDLVMNANGEWSVQWDTQTADCSNGTQDLDTWAYRDDGSGGQRDHHRRSQQLVPTPA